MRELISGSGLLRVCWAGRDKGCFAFAWRAVIKAALRGAARGATEKAEQLVAKLLGHKKTAQQKYFRRAALIFALMKGSFRKCYLPY